MFLIMSNNVAKRCEIGSRSVAQNYSKVPFSTLNEKMAYGLGAIGRVDAERVTVSLGRVSNEEGPFDAERGESSFGFDAIDTAMKPRLQIID